MYFHLPSETSLIYVIIPLRFCMWEGVSQFWKNFVKLRFALLQCEQEAAFELFWGWLRIFKYLCRFCPRSSHSIYLSLFLASAYHHFLVHLEGSNIIASLLKCNRFGKTDLLIRPFQWVWRYMKCRLIRKTGFSREPYHESLVVCKDFLLFFKIPDY